MIESLRRISWIAVAVLAAAILLLSIETRTDPFVDDAHPEQTQLGEDPATGAVLVDLDDDADRSDEDRVAALVRRAVAPFGWPSGRAALGRELSDAANLYRVSVPASEVSDVLRMLAEDSDVEGVEVERAWSLPEGAAASFAMVGSDDGEPPAPADDPDVFRPNDPYYRHQWHMDQIQMPRAWTRSRGKGAVVAVIDTGVLFRDRGAHRRAPDLANTRFVDGYDFVRNDATPDDEHGHGTHVAGTVAQSTNNGIGVTGVAPEAAIMPLKVLDRNGSGGWGGIAAAIRWAADHGANVINMSLGGSMPSQTVRRAIDYAHKRGVVIVAAAGNASRSRVEYPAAHAHVIAVGSVRYDRTLAFYSCYGRGLDLVAPGGDLRVDQNGDGMPDGVLQNTMVPRNPGRHDYLAYQGTSMASPHVAGVAALLVSAGVKDPDTVESILERSARNLKDRRRYAHGLVQADAALRMAREGLGGTRGGLALLLGAALMLGLRRRGTLAVGLAPTLAVAALVAGGLALVPWSAVGLTAFGDAAALGAPGALAHAVGPWVAPLVLSAVVPLLLAALLLHVRRALPIIVGTAIAFAVWLGLEALLPTADVGLLPAWAVGPWLLVNAVVAALIARLAATRKR